MLAYRRITREVFFRFLRNALLLVTSLDILKANGREWWVVLPCNTGVPNRLASKSLPLLADRQRPFHVPSQTWTENATS